MNGKEMKEWIDERKMNEWTDDGKMNEKSYDEGPMKDRMKESIDEGTMKMN